MAACYQYLSHALILNSTQMRAASDPFVHSAKAENGERSANEMRATDWVTLVVALADLVFRYVEMRSARRNNDGPDLSNL
ncbi:hypothetical protein A1sIIB106_02365 [Candidatus Planktophila lacus]|uniref:Uncharacterized protein n=1 Tax=Candidatus Planktophila lacus TaxID=1884913 RepID=A0AAC9YQ79_9ACTN|nr:hypothetical protein A1s21148_02550 [Candidatus Planktophila lacus]ASY24889.1 hypothetical protein A1sIIB106_02365 [Candidatus Planktophila lacus]ASY28842.1 hypothetical protein A1sIIB60_02390 [Candidatus Planktophila lacus]